MSQAFHLQPFWQELLIELMRVPIRVSLLMHKSHHKNLEHLFKVAIFRELSSLGITQDRMAVLISSTSKTIRNYQVLARDLRTRSPQTTPADEILKALSKGSRTYDELYEIACAGDEALDAGWLLGWLQGEGYIKLKKSARTRTYEAGRKLHTIADLDAAPENEDLIYEVKIPIVRAIHGCPGIQRQTLTFSPEIATFPEPVVEAALNELLAAGIIRKEETETGEDIGYFPLTDHVNVSASGPRSRLRGGLHKLAEKMAWSAETLFLSGEGHLNSQRTFIFDADPSDVTLFFKELRDYTLDRVKELEAKRNPLKSRRFAIFWHGGPFNSK